MKICELIKIKISYKTYLIYICKIENSWEEILFQLPCFRDPPCIESIWLSVCRNLIILRIRLILTRRRSTLTRSFSSTARRFVDFLLLPCTVIFAGAKSNAHARFARRAKLATAYRGFMQCVGTRAYTDRFTYCRLTLSSLPSFPLRVDL